MDCLSLDTDKTSLRTGATVTIVRLTTGSVDFSRFIIQPYVLN